METDFVDWLLPRLPADPRLEVPAGDDAAVLRPPAQRRTVVTVDMLMEGVDFILGPDCPPQAVGHKALAVNLSDLAAMAARPEAAVVAVAPRRRHARPRPAGGNRGPRGPARRGPGRRRHQRLGRPAGRERDRHR
jgi:hypothetical protein